MDAACGPLRRTIPMPPRPGGVEMAAIVSATVSGAAIRCIQCSVCDERLLFSFAPAAPQSPKAADGSVQGTLVTRKRRDQKEVFCGRVLVDSGARCGFCSRILAAACFRFLRRTNSRRSTRSNGHLQGRARYARSASLILPGSLRPSMWWFLQLPASAPAQWNSPGASEEVQA